MTEPVARTKLPRREGEFDLVAPIGVSSPVLVGADHQDFEIHSSENKEIHVKRRSKTSVAIGFALLLSLTFSSLAQASVTSWYPQNSGTIFSGTGPSTSPPSGKHICYNAHVANIGWQGWKCDGQTAGGTTNKIEALAIYPAWLIEVQAHLQTSGWTPHAFIGAQVPGTIGTTGLSRRLEALAIEAPYNFSIPSHRVCGRANVQGLGWLAQDCATGKTGAGQPHGIAVIGTIGQSRAMYSIWLTLN